MYGNEAEPIEKILQEIRDLKSIGETDNESNLKGLIKLSQLCQRIEVANLENDDLRHFSSQIGIKTIVEKAPPRMQRAWASFVVKREKKGKKATLKHFQERLSDEITAKTHPIYRKHTTTPSTKALATDTRPFRRDNSEATVAQETSNATSGSPRAPKKGSGTPSSRDKRKSCAVHGDKVHHDTAACKVFRNNSIPERNEAIKKANHCIKCLKPGHQYKTCKHSVKCSVCQGTNHHKLLCYKAAKNKPPTKNQNSEPSENAKPPSGSHQTSENSTRIISRSKETTETSGAAAPEPSAGSK